MYDFAAHEGEGEYLDEEDADVRLDAILAAKNVAPVVGTCTDGLVPIHP